MFSKTLVRGTLFWSLIPSIRHYLVSLVPALALPPCTWVTHLYSISVKNLSASLPFWDHGLSIYGLVYRLVLSSSAGNFSVLALPLFVDAHLGLYAVWPILPSTNKRKKDSILWMGVRSPETDQVNCQLCVPTWWNISIRQFNRMSVPNTGIHR